MKSSVQALYEEYQPLSEPKADTSKAKFSDLFKKTKDFLLDTGRKYGVIPYYGGFKDHVEPKEAIVEPVYSGFSGVARKYYLKAAERVAEYYGKTQDWLPVIGENIKEVVVGKLPTYWSLFLEKVKDGYRIVPKIVGKIYGAFDPNSKKLYLDTANFSEVADPEKRFLKESGLPTDSGLETPVHELIHTVQDRKGVLKKYSREDIEGETSIITEEILGRPVSGMYPKEKARYRSRYGDKKITQLAVVDRPVSKYAVAA